MLLFNTLLKSRISIEVSFDKSDISVDNSALKLATSLESSEEVYPDKSLIPVLTLVLTLVSMVVLRVVIVLNVTEERSLISKLVLVI